MTDNTSSTTSTVSDNSSDLMNSVKAELLKGAKESVKGKLKEILKKRGELEKNIRLLDLEASKLIEDFNNGVL